MRYLGSLRLIWLWGILAVFAASLGAYFAGWVYTDPLLPISNRLGLLFCIALMIPAVIRRFNVIHVIAAFAGAIALIYVHRWVETAGFVFESQRIEVALVLFIGIIFISQWIVELVSPTDNAGDDPASAAALIQAAMSNKQIRTNPIHFLSALALAFIILISLVTMIIQVVEANGQTFPMGRANGIPIDQLIWPFLATGSWCAVAWALTANHKAGVVQYILKYWPSKEHDFVRLKWYQDTFWVFIIALLCSLALFGWSKEHSTASGLASFEFHALSSAAIIFLLSIRPIYSALIFGEIFVESARRQLRPHPKFVLILFIKYLFDVLSGVLAALLFLKFFRHSYIEIAIVLGLLCVKAVGSLTAWAVVQIIQRRLVGYVSYPSE